MARNTKQFVEQALRDDECRGGDDRWPGDQLFVLVQLRETFVQSAFEVAGARVRGFRFHFQGPACRLGVEELGVAHVPVVDLAGQALLHQAADLGDPGGDELVRSGQFFGYAFDDGPVQRDGLHPCGQPGCVPQGSRHCPFGIIQGGVVQVPRLAGGAHPVGTLGVHLRETELLRDRSGRVVAVGDLVGDRDQQRVVPRRGRAGRRASCLA